MKSKIVFSLIFFLLVAALAASLYWAGPVPFAPKKHFGQKRAPIEKLER